MNIKEFAKKYKTELIACGAAVSIGVAAVCIKKHDFIKLDGLCFNGNGKDLIDVFVTNKNGHCVEKLTYKTDELLEEIFTSSGQYIGKSLWIAEPGDVILHDNEFTAIMNAIDNSKIDIVADEVLKRFK